MCHVTSPNREVWEVLVFKQEVISGEQVTRIRVGGSGVISDESL